MSDITKAVFLSYAREDADAARKIAEALRQGGVEVWFDETELRGGDAWEQKICRQIRACALFLPVLSANTRARRKGGTGGSAEPGFRAGKIHRRAGVCQPEQRPRQRIFFRWDQRGVAQRAREGAGAEGLGANLRVLFQGQEHTRPRNRKKTRRGL